ncbi:Cysteinyl-tRNA synthetase [Prochlorococcus sp. SS52]|nr:Cysteinyl-tRNA synthetase [Prochlorococcus marinus str. SS2]KGG25142.1 Cysteinyl-tRNA synthetase [Prochlorococcus marinus str. SS35]KGG35587.1 Cysteinyl-tRNA synthetase [Prochlorococcus sp. SS52]
MPSKQLIQCFLLNSLNKKVPLKLTNTLTRRTETFSSLKPGEVSIYCCGVTVYDLCHLGHARSYIVWDVLRRYFIAQGYKVKFVQNFTDIDDKILARASKENCTMNEVSERNIEEFHRDMDALGILRPDRMPRATRCLEEIKSMIEELEKKGAAYSAEGDVYFAVMKHANYGKLSKRDLSEQQLNADGRVTDKEEARKQNPFDFALWKAAKEGEQSFPSPWGAGRPGWHIECSAMVLQELGETIDIHLGGADLIFPHHENEIAQSEVANGKKLAKYWLHNGMVNVGGQKMSKSLGNFTTIRALLKEGISAMTLRLFILQAHYRKPLDFTKESLDAASTGWKRLNVILCLGLMKHQTLNWPKPNIQESKITSLSKHSLNETLNLSRQQFIDALNNDINTSVAISILFELARPLRSLSNQIENGSSELISESDKHTSYSRWLLLTELANVLGLQAELPKTRTSKQSQNLDEVLIREAIQERKDAKLSGDFAKADKIREELNLKGVQLIDKKDGVTEWIQS